MFCCSTKLLIFKLLLDIRCGGFPSDSSAVKFSLGCETWCPRVTCRDKSGGKSPKLANQLDYTSIAHFLVSIRNIGREIANLIHPRQKIIQDLRKTALRCPTQLLQALNAGNTVPVVAHSEIS